MKIDRRNFIRTTGLLALVGVTGVETLFAASEKKVIRTSKKGLSLNFLTYDLQLAPGADWADLDGNLLISNDPYSGMQIVNGKVTLIDQPGIGVKEEKKVF